MVRKGSLASSRSAAIRLTRLIPRRCWPSTTSSNSADGHPAPLALGAGAGDIGVLGYLHRNLGQLDDLPSALGPAAGQLDPTIGTPLQRVLHTLVGRHSGSGKARATGLARLLGSIRSPVAFGLQAGHPSRTAGLALAFRLGNPLLQAFNDGLLSDDDADEHIPVGSPEINFTVHPSYMT